MNRRNFKNIGKAFTPLSLLFCPLAAALMFSTLPAHGQQDPLAALG